MPGPGGKRSGAGRKPGVPNKKTSALQAAIAASGQTPLDYMVARMRNPKLKEEKRFAAAQAAAPYLHPRLQTIDNKLTGEIKLTVVRFSDASNSGHAP